MRIISRRIIRKFCEKHSDAASALDRWYNIMKKAEIASFAELRELFSTADMVGKYVVFNIGGNKYRLISHIHFNKKIIYIREIFTHEEYDKNQWKE
jgi:mRNA interferase HigB